MQASVFIDRLKAEGVTLQVVGPNRLSYSGPEAALTPAVLEELRHHKPALLALLAPPPVEPPPPALVLAPPRTEDNAPDLHAAALALVELHNRGCAVGRGPDGRLRVQLAGRDDDAGARRLSAPHRAGLARLLDLYPAPWLAEVALAWPERLRAAWTMLRAADDRDAWQRLRWWALPRGYLPQWHGAPVRPLTLTADEVCAAVEGAAPAAHLDAAPATG